MSKDGKTFYKIKTIKKGNSIDLADIFRNANEQNDFILVIGFWEGNKNNIETVRVEVEINKWKKMFNIELMKDLRNFIDTASNDKSFDIQWKNECRRLKNMWGKDLIIQPRFKRDSKTQKRIQCAINYGKLSDFLKEFKWRKE